MKEESQARPNRSQLVLLALQAGAFCGGVVAGLAASSADLDVLYVVSCLVLGFLGGGALGWLTASLLVAFFQAVLPSGRPQTLVLTAAAASATAALASYAVALIASSPVLTLEPALAATAVTFVFGFPGTGP